MSRASSAAGEKSGRKESGLGSETGASPLPNVWRQWRAQRVHCTPGLGRAGYCTGDARHEARRARRCVSCFRNWSSGASRTTSM